MAIILSSLLGGITDPYDSEGPITNTNLQFLASNEDITFLDLIDINLTPADPSLTYIAITNVEIGTYVEGLPVSTNDLTDNTTTQINVTYEEPSVVSFVLSNVNITTNIYNLSTQANVIVSGKYSGIFPDKFYKYVNLTNNTNFTVKDINLIPSSNVNLHLYKASFMRHNTVLFYLNVTYDSSFTESFVLQKRILNDWELGRVSLVSKLTTIGI